VCSSVADFSVDVMVELMIGWSCEFSNLLVYL
jgi:hypothetical protein